VKEPVRVVVLTSGPGLGNGVREFIRQLELHPKIELSAVIWQTKDPTFRGVVADLWRRRRWLAGPLLLQKYLGGLMRFILRPANEFKLARTVHAVRDRIYCFEDIHSPQALSRLRECHPQLSLVYGAPIIRKSLYAIAALGTLGIHHGKVPEYRGKKTTFWEIYNGETMAGVTIQRINDTLDGGDIVESGEVTVGLRLPWLIWRDLEQMGMGLYMKAIQDVSGGCATFSQQQGLMKKPYRDPGVGDILRYWLRYIRRLVRGIIPGANPRKMDG
jgi:hypothetical protein